MDNTMNSSSELSENAQELCRFCLVEKAEMVQMPWQDWERSELSQLYEEVMKLKLPDSKRCSRFYCDDCLTLLRSTAESIKMFMEVDCFWRKYVLNNATTAAGDSNEVLANLKIEIQSNGDGQYYEQEIDEVKDDLIQFIEIKSENYEVSEELFSMLDIGDMEEYNEADHLSTTPMELEEDSEYNVHVVRKSKRTPLPKRRRSSSSSEDGQEYIKSPVVKKLVKRSKADLECKICSKKFSSSKSLSYHRSTHITLIDDMVTCEICSKKFRHRRYLQKHVRLAHSEDDPVSCERCDKTFRNGYCLNRHNQRCHNEKNEGEEFQCKICESQFTSSAGLKNHCEIHNRTADDVTECGQCGKVYGSPSLLQRHVRKAHAPIDHSPCHICDKVFLNKFRLKNHMVRHTEKKLQCDECKRMFLLKKDLKAHLLLRHVTDNPWCCEMCGLTFKTTDKLRNHVANCGQSDSQLISVRKRPNGKMHLYEEPVTPMQCELCPRAYMIMKSLEIHYAKSHPEEDWDCVSKTYCQQCHIKCRDLEDLEEHRKVHRNLQCYICNRFLSTETSLQHHIKSHSDKERPFPCEVCGVSFVRVTHLKAHVRRMHSTDRNYKCDECGKTFVEKFELNAHIRGVHLKVRRYVCFCGQTCTTKSRMEVHMAIHTREYKWACNLCEKKFSQSSQLKVHTANLHGATETVQRSALYHQATIRY